MTALRDPRMELFARELAAALAAGVKPSAAAKQAGQVAGYPNPKGKSFAPNCRKRAQRKDVKARVAEILAPALKRADDATGATVEWAATKLFNIADPDLGPDSITTPDQIRAIDLLAKLRGWMAPERHDHVLRTNAMTDDELARIAAGGRAGALAAPVGS
jgi:hypothetical protein